MAVIQYSALVTQLRGKLGGSQFNKGHAGYSLQRKSTPTTRQSPAQMAQRQRLSIVQRAWKEETPERQLQAAQAAQSNPVSNRLGQQVVLSGYNHYVKMMAWRLLAGVGQETRSLSIAIDTTPQPSLVQHLPNLVIELVGGYNDGGYVVNVSSNKNREGIWGGSVQAIRAYIYIQPSDESGKPLTNSRRVFVAYEIWKSTGVSLANLRVLTSEYLATGMHVLVEVINRNIDAGAVVGYSSQVIQLQ